MVSDLQWSLTCNGNMKFVKNDRNMRKFVYHTLILIVTYRNVPLVQIFMAEIFFGPPNLIKDLTHIS